MICLTHGTGPPKIPNCKHTKLAIECCKKDKFEDCLTANLQCYDDTSCSAETRLKMSKFIGCFEGSHIEEDHCPSDPKNCTEYAGLQDKYPAIMKCFNSPPLVKKAAEFNTAACTAQNITAWPHVLVDKKLTFDVVPILPTLCAAYKGTPKPASCTKYEQGLISVV